MDLVYKDRKWIEDFQQWQRVEVWILNVMRWWVVYVT